MGENEDVLVTVDDGVGLITLNRPKAINSLTHPMVTTISRVLTDWEPDDAIRAFLAGRLDYLAIGNFLVQHPRHEEINRERGRAK